jgi:3D (Asp-Asp-Asp) domain-containing protein
MFTVALLVGLAIGFLLGAFTVLMLEYSAEEPNQEPSKSTEVQPTQSVIPMPEVTVEPEPEYLGEFRITAYCSCEICCGKWAENRPDGIVYGASGEELVAGVSCASPLPFGTVVEIEGVGTYIVQDRTSSWVVDKYGENLIDIYFDDHEAAREFGLQYHDVYLKEGENNDQM